MQLKIIENLKDQISEQFLQGMCDRMFTGYFRYGAVALTFPSKVDALACLQLRLEKYKETGNTEYLMDAGNFLMIEFMHPKHPNAHFEAMDDKDSPGGITNEGKRFRENLNKKYEYKREGD